MPGPSQKPNASFFRKIATGAVGTQRVLRHLRALGHTPVILEPGADDVRIWQEEKPKGFRIPDILCLECGRRIESRAKTDKPELTLSHSDTTPDRHWDYGLHDDDWIAIVVCAYERDADGDRREEAIFRGHLDRETAYWYERSRIPWRSSPVVSYFPVQAFKNAGAYTARTKGVTEGSETQISWDARFATTAGTVTEIKKKTYALNPAACTIRESQSGFARPPFRGPDASKLPVRLIGVQVNYKPRNGGRTRWCQLPYGDPDPRKPIHVCVDVGSRVEEGEVLLSEVPPVGNRRCPGRPAGGHQLGQLLHSESVVDRYVGVRLARALEDRGHWRTIARLALNDDSLQVRLQALLYALTVLDSSGHRLVMLLQSQDVSVALQAVSTLSSLADGSEVERKKGRKLLENLQQGGPHFLRVVSRWVGPDPSLTPFLADQRAHPLLVPASVSEDVRSTALWVLGRLGAGIALDLILGEMANPSYFVRAEALSAIGSQRISVEDLAQRLLSRGEYEISDECRAGIAEAIWRRVRRGRDDADEWITVLLADAALSVDDAAVVELLGRLLPLASDELQARAQEALAAEGPALAAAVKQVARMEVSWTRDHIDPSYRWM